MMPPHPQANVSALSRKLAVWSETNGWETLEKLDAKKLAPPPSVIIITPRPNQQAAGREAGVEAVLEKPLDFPRLIETVSQALAKAVNSNKAA
jgi:CheY-like chemotaxis protein